jgi:hypothetical protein
MGIPEGNPDGDVGIQLSCPRYLAITIAPAPIRYTRKFEIYLKTIDPFPRFEAALTVFQTGHCPPSSSHDNLRYP